jgi:hypothetical protein
MKNSHDGAIIEETYITKCFICDQLDVSILKVNQNFRYPNQGTQPPFKPHELDGGSFLPLIPKSLVNLLVIPQPVYVEVGDGKSGILYIEDGLL